MRTPVMVLEKNAGNAGGKHLQRSARLALTPLKRPEVLDESRERPQRSIHRWFHCWIPPRWISTSIDRKALWIDRPSYQCRQPNGHARRARVQLVKVTAFYNSWDPTLVKLTV
jgi:hypothetical protein